MYELAAFVTGTNTVGNEVVEIRNGDYSPESAFVVF